MRWPPLLLASLLLACRADVARPPEVAVADLTLNPEAVAGARDPALRRLLHDHWEETLARSPTWATALGDHRYDDRLEDLSAEAVARDRAVRDALLDRGRAIAAGPLDAGDQVTIALFVDELARDAATDRCGFETWQVGPMWNPVAGYSYLPELHTVVTPRDAEALLARYRAVPKAIDDSLANLRRGLASDRVATGQAVRRTVESVELQLATPLDEWPLLAPAAVDHAAWDAAFAERWRGELRAVVADEIRPAFERYRDALRDEVLPKARPDAKSGLVWLPDGEACYAATIAHHTTLARPADEVHQIGLAELERIHAEMRELGERALGTRDLAEIFARLRSDPALYFATAEEVEAKAQASLARAREAIPRYFGRLPKAECVVRRIPEHEAPYAYVAYYRPAHPDGSKPGEYFVNVSEPTTRPRYEAEALAFHESIPGHHLQIAIAQELPDTPAFRRHAYLTAYAEGWALYTEVLADEMGLYSGDLDRMGRLSFDAWRAARLVVDTGIHAKGWSRDEAVRFMVANTPLAENNIANEVDRYVVWPGQALGYKLGQLEILALRAEAEARHGERFDLRGFHDVVLDGGSLPLPLLRERVEAWAPDQR